MVVALLLVVVLVVVFDLVVLVLVSVLSAATVDFQHRGGTEARRGHGPGRGYGREHGRTGPRGRARRRMAREASARGTTPGTARRIKPGILHFGDAICTTQAGRGDTGGRAAPCSRHGRGTGWGGMPAHCDGLCCCLQRVCRIEAIPLSGSASLSGWDGRALEGCRCKCRCCCVNNFQQLSALL